MPWKSKSHAERQRGDRQNDRAYNQNRRKVDPALRMAQRFRSKARWRKVREIVLGRNPLCLDPLGLHKHNAESVPAMEVHHITPLRSRPDLAYSLDNLAALCVRCHRKVEAMEERNNGSTMRYFTGNIDREGGSRD